MLFCTQRHYHRMRPETKPTTVHCTNVESNMRKLIKLHLHVVSFIFSEDVCTCVYHCIPVTSDLVYKTYDCPKRQPVKALLIVEVCDDYLKYKPVVQARTNITYCA